MRQTNKFNPLSKSSEKHKEIEKTAGESCSSGRDEEGPLSDVSRRAVANILKRVKSHEVQGSKLKNSYRNQYDFVDEQKSSVETKIRHNADRGKNILQPQSEEEEEEEDESIWEDWPFPTSSSTNTHKNDVVNEFAIEFEEEMPDYVKHKIIRRRATAEDKELAELVHKVHLLCLLARGRLIDSACDDLLIQASFHSLIPHSFMRISNTTDLKVADLIPLVRWIHDTFRVRSPSNSKKSILSALQFALGNKEGTAEEVTALSVALFRALNFTTRFVTILNVASLKPEADKPELVDQSPSKARESIFHSSTLMVDKQLSPDETEKFEAEKSKSLDNSLENTPTNAGSSAKSEGAKKRKGDLEFEMQLEFAMFCSATKDSSNPEVSPHRVKKQKKIKVVESSSSSSQGISTAYGSKKGGTSLYWAEVYCGRVNSTGKWVHIDVVNNIINAEEQVEAAAAACKTSMRYVVAFAGFGAKDVTRRYCNKWYKIEKQRIDPVWWDKTLAPLKELELRATSENSITRSSVEDMELETRSLTEPLPTNQQAYKGHHLYALEKWLTKYQILHPKGPVLGFCSGHPVYPRTCVQNLHTKFRWLREGLQVRANEFPAKVLRSSLKLSTGQSSEADNEFQNGDEKNTELYGMWQTESLSLPRAVDGKVPKNEHGQVDMWSEKCLPPGTVHLKLPRVAFVAKRLGIDYAPAMIGFEFRKGGSIPVFEGIVVCSEFKESILLAYVEEHERREAEEKKKYEAQALSRWYQLLSSIVTRQMLKDRYGSGSVSTTSNVTLKTNYTNQDNRLSDGQDEENIPERKDSSSMVQTKEHEHEFITIHQDHNEESNTKTKRCRCGFSIEVEEL